MVINVFLYVLLFHSFIYGILDFGSKLIKLGTLDLELNTSCIWTQKKIIVALKGFKQLQYLKRKQNNNNLGMFSPVQLNHSKPNQIEIKKIV